MPRKIPIFRDLLKWREPITFDGVTYHLDFEYSVRADRWYMTVLDDDENVLQSSTKVTTNWPLFQNNIEEMPSGQLLCVRTDDSTRDPNRLELGETAILLYFSEDEFPEPQPLYPGLDVRVPRPAFFRVNIQSTNSPVEVEETLDVGVRVQNTGDTEGTKFIELLDFDDNLVDSIEPTMERGSDINPTLQWETDVGDDGEGFITVRTEDSFDIVEVRITPFGIGDIEGSITSSDSEIPIGTNEGRAVTEDGDRAYIDEQGQYLLEGVDATALDVTADALGFAEQTTTVNVADGSTVTQDFTLDPHTEYTYGIVTDADGGEPISNATVELIEDSFDEHNDPVGTTYEVDEDGWYEINSSNGIFRYEFHADGYETKEELVGVEIDSSPGERLDVQLESE